LRDHGEPQGRKVDALLAHVESRIAFSQPCACGPRDAR
jgi:hypothetical protein